MIIGVYVDLMIVGEFKMEIFGVILDESCVGCFGEIEEWMFVVGWVVWVDGDYFCG